MTTKVPGPDAGRLALAVVGGGGGGGCGGVSRVRWIGSGVEPRRPPPNPPPTTHGGPGRGRGYDDRRGGGFSRAFRRQWSMSVLAMWHDSADPWIVTYHKEEEKESLARRSMRMLHVYPHVPTHEVTSSLGVCEYGQSIVRTTSCDMNLRDEASCRQYMALLHSEVLCSRAATAGGG